MTKHWWMVFSLITGILLVVLWRSHSSLDTDLRFQAHKVPFSSLFTHLTEDGLVLGLRQTNEDFSLLSIWNPEQELEEHEIPIEWIRSFFVNNRNEVVGQMGQSAMNEIFYWSPNGGLRTWTTDEFKDALGWYRIGRENAEGRDHVSPRSRSQTRILGINDHSQILAMIEANAMTQKSMLVSCTSETLACKSVFEHGQSIGFTSNGWACAFVWGATQPKSPGIPRGEPSRVRFFDGNRFLDVEAPFDSLPPMTSSEIKNSTEVMGRLFWNTVQYVVLGRETPRIRKTSSQTVNTRGQSVEKRWNSWVELPFFKGWIGKLANQPWIPQWFRKLTAPKLQLVYIDGEKEWNLDSLLESSMPIRFDSLLDIKENGQILCLGYGEDGYQTILLTPVEAATD